MTAAPETDSMSKVSEANDGAAGANKSMIQGAAGPVEGADDPEAGVCAVSAVDGKEITESLARDIALRLLTVRARSRHELSQRLTKRGVPAEIITKVLDWLTEYRYLDDREFARMWLTGVRAETRSSYLLRRELREKGVSEADIELAMAELPADAELTAAISVAEKKWRSVANLPSEVQYRRMISALARRGFGFELAKAAIAEVRERNQ